MFVTDETGYTLTGVLDGQNREFSTSRAMRTDLPVEVFVNGDRMVAGLDDGFDVTGPSTVRLRLAPVPLDTVAVKYSVDPPAIGILGGVPQISGALVLGPQVTIEAPLMPQAVVVVVSP